eukprot:4741863-Heterocapsa_arctica.AAC.1
MVPGRPGLPRGPGMELAREDQARRSAYHRGGAAPGGVWTPSGQAAVCGVDAVSCDDCLDSGPGLRRSAVGAEG